MKKFCHLFFSILFFNGFGAFAANGDTTYVKPFNKVSMNHYGNFDQWGVFPSSTKKFHKILMKYTVGCDNNGQCEWDYTNTIYFHNDNHTKDSTIKKATTFTVNGAVKDSFNYSTDTTWTTSYNSTTKKTDSVPASVITIIHFTFLSQQQPQVPVDTIKVWPVQYYKYYFDTTGKKKDSAYVQVKQTVRAVYTNYYSVFEKFVDYEMGRMITPYAKSGTIPRPWTYEYLYDVTDYASFLHDSAIIRMNYSGYTWGFNATIEFYMIEGTPAREAYKVENVWNGYFAYGSPTDTLEKHLAPYNFVKDTSCSSVKLRMTITGHGADGTNCCEFQPKQYFVKLNKTQIAQNYVWKGDCGSNPIINQGGTWIYDRANWCPGMIVNPYEYNLNCIAGANTVDVDMEPYLNNGKGGYAYGAQLIYYKNNAYQVDAGMEKIIAPTKEFIFNRNNPICDNAVVRIRNYGVSDLTSATINYQVGNGIPQTFNWTGKLKFDESATITMSQINWANPSGSQSFTAWIDKANGQTDQNPFNNSLTSQIDLPLVLPLSFIIETQTNNADTDNTYTLNSWSGHTFFYRDFRKPNTIFRDTFNLGYGCYNFHFVDSAGDGLSFWNNTAAGNGYTRIVKNPINSPNPILKTFNADFGNFLDFNFRLGTPVDVTESIDLSSTISIYPVPASEKLNIKSEKVYLIQSRLIALDGREVKVFTFEDMVSGMLDISAVPCGMFFLQLTGINGEQVMKKVVVIK